MVKTIWDNNLREIQIPDWAKFADVFDDDGIKDVFASGPYQFKEIEQLIFPKAWTSERKMRDQSLEPFKFEQDIRKIMSVILQVGEFELHLDNERLITYAYK